MQKESLLFFSFPRRSNLGFVEGTPANTFDFVEGTPARQNEEHSFFLL